jgi:hypothetical protein
MLRNVEGRCEIVCPLEGYVETLPRAKSTKCVVGQELSNGEWKTSVVEPVGAQKAYPM